MEDAKPKTAASTAIPTATVPPAVQVEFKRDEKAFSTSYANSVVVESNAFDLKLIFGLYDHRNPAKPIIEQFSSMNISWPEVKLLIFWMQLHLVSYENDNGKVKIPANAIPPELPPIPEQFDNPKGREVFEVMRKMRAEFLAKLSEP
jgi:hypothetical protein